MSQHPILDQLRDVIPGMAARAQGLDDAAQFPTEDIAILGDLGLLLAPLPHRVGGLGLGSEPAGAEEALTLLRMLGEGNLAVGRVFEAHVNAIRLIARYGTTEYLAEAARDAADGMLFALWVTDPPDGGLDLMDGALRGRKQFCSGAGRVRRAVVTAQDNQGRTRLAVVKLETGVAFTPLAGGMQGMRAATTGQVVFDDTPATVFGEADDYLREPDFSTGAWRTSAVTLGGLDALVAETTRQLRNRGRLDDPHQKARMGHILMAHETARLWMQEAAIRAENADDHPADAIAYVNLARLAVERAGLEIIALAQRSLGVAAFLRPNPVERLCRDLATYLRQPAPDMVLTEAVEHFTRT